VPPPEEEDGHEHEPERETEEPEGEQANRSAGSCLPGAFPRRPTRGQAEGRRSRGREGERAGAARRKARQ
jgi:hypothetical protein